MLPSGQRLTQLCKIRSDTVLPSGQRLTQLCKIRSDTVLPSGQRLTQLCKIRSDTVLPSGQSLNVHNESDARGVVHVDFAEVRDPRVSVHDERQ